MSLQTVLIIIGCIVIACIYVASRVATQNSSPKNKAFFGKDFKGTEADLEITLLASSDDVQLESQLDLELSEDPQLGLFEAPEERSNLILEDGQVMSLTDAIETSEQNKEEILQLFLKPSDGEIFQGMDILRSLNHVGMVFGSMGIFHKEVEGDNEIVEILFSAANMFEPGSFNLQQIETERCRGLVFFMKLPSSIDDGVALETLLTTTGQVAKLLHGNLYKTPEETLDDDFLDALRLKTNFIVDNG